jgi:hypothetical protein
MVQPIDLPHLGSGEVKDRYVAKDEAPPVSPAVAEGCGQCAAAEKEATGAEVSSGEEKCNNPSQVSEKKRRLKELEKAFAQLEKNVEALQLRLYRGLDLDDYWL